MVKSNVVTVNVKLNCDRGVWSASASPQVFKLGSVITFTSTVKGLNPLCYKHHTLTVKRWWGNPFTTVSNESDSKTVIVKSKPLNQYGLYVVLFYDNLQKSGEAGFGLYCPYPTDKLPLAVNINTGEKYAYHEAYMPLCDQLCGSGWLRCGSPSQYRVITKTKVKLSNELAQFPEPGTNRLWLCEACSNPLYKAYCGYIEL